MKLISFHYNGRERYGAVKEGGIVDLSSEKFQETALKNLKAVLEAGSDAMTDLKRIVEAKAAEIDLGDVTFRIPVNNPSKIIQIDI